MNGCPAKKGGFQQKASVNKQRNKGEIKSLEERRD